MAIEHSPAEARGGHEESPERFDPDTMGGGLMEAEHRSRYWWAAQWVAGKDVLDAGCGLGYGTRLLADQGPSRLVAVDVSAEALERTAGEGIETVEADVRDLPFEADTFDVIVCFEVIEHVESHERVVGELQRVLRPGGTLLISSPNRDVYTPGNPHHVHEFLPEELREVLAGHFREVAMYGQSAHLASAIVVKGPSERAPVPFLAAGIQADEPGSETYAIAVASDQLPPDQSGLIALVSPFEVRWWHEQVENFRAELQATQTRAREAEERFNRRVLELEQELAGVVQLEHDLEIATRDLDAADQALVIERQIVRDLKSSLSWKLTAPLRAAKRLFR